MKAHVYDNSFRNVIGLSAAFMIMSGSVQLMHGERMAHDMRLAPGEDFVLDIPSGIGGYDFETRVAMKGNGNANGLGKAKWGIQWTNADGNTVMELSVGYGNESLGDYLDRRYMLVMVDSIAADGHRYNKISRTLYDGVNLYSGFNYLLFEVDGSVFRGWIGDDSQYSIGECRMPENAISMKLSGTNKLEVKYVACRFVEDKADAISTEWTLEGIGDYLEGRRDAIEGYWHFLDRDTDLKWADLGGRYRLAVVRHKSPVDMGRDRTWGMDAAPVYDMIYIDGARVNGNNWHTGMLKGYLYPTIFENHYKVVWFDAKMDCMYEEVSADITDGAIITINIPLYHAKIRFSKEL